MAESKIKKRWRKKLGVAAKAAPYITGVAGAYVGYKYGAAAGAAVTGAGYGIARYGGAAAARGKGKRGDEARAVGSRLAGRALIGGGIGAGLGVATAGVQTYMQTGSANKAWGAVVGGRENLFGLSAMTEGGLDAAVPSLQKAFGFATRTMQKDKPKKGGLDLMGGLGDLWGRGKGKGEEAESVPGLVAGGGGTAGIVGSEDGGGGGSGAAVAVAVGLGLLFLTG